MSTRQTREQLERLTRDLEASRSQLQALQEKLWKLASNPFFVLGEAQFTKDGIALTVLGNLDPEQKLGLAPGSFPKTLDASLGELHPDDRKGFAQAVERSRHTGDPFSMNYRLADGRGGWRWIAGEAVSLGVVGRDHVRWVFTNRDLSPQHSAEEHLEESAQRLEASRSESRAEKEKLWKVAANAFTLLGEATLTDEGFNLQYFGDGPLESKIGLQPGTIPRNVASVEAIIHPVDLQPYQEALERTVATGEPFRLVYRLSDGLGGWRWIQTRAIAQEQRNGRYVRWLFDNIDITDRKESEEELHRSLQELRQLKAQLQGENRFLREEVSRTSEHGTIVGDSAAVHRILEQVKLVGATASTVLITGETGTGKELVARAIHQDSVRRDRLFVAVNCAALPASLVESELFGHEKGAFTGAIARRLGRFEQADGGTLFLDEVGELPPEAQAKMLRVLQSGEFERVGGSRLLRTDVRLIAATNRDLEHAMRQGLFRSDLYHRLAVFPIDLPPLRERPEDIPELAAYLLTRKARQLKRRIEPLAAGVLDRLCAYDWPGNVRELENVLERAIILTSGSSIEVHAVHLGPGPQPKAPEHSAPILRATEAPEGNTLRECERAHILRVCAAKGWKIKGLGGAAAALGLNPGTLYSRMKKLGIRHPERMPKPEDK